MMGDYMMNKPKMILFDYRQTIISETQFDGIGGTRAVLANCVNNPHNISAEDIQSLANEMNRDIGRYDPKTNHLYLIDTGFYQNFTCACIWFLPPTDIIMRRFDQHTIMYLEESLT